MEYKKLGHIAKIQTGPFGSQLHQSDYKPTGIPCIMPCNIGSNLNIICDNIAYISEEDLNRLAKHKTQEGDIVYSRRGDIEKCAYISSRESGWLCGTGCLKVSVDSTIALPKYVAYLLSTPESKAWLVGNAVGTTMLNLNTTVLSDFPICLPDLDTQQKVVEIIDSIADKIELNKRINDNLEQQAQALYKSWFVDFEPFKDGKFIESELGLIPEGWSIIKVGELPLYISDYVSNGSFASLKENVTLYETPNYAQFIRNTDLKSQQFSVWVDEASYEFLGKSKLTGGEIIISNVGDVGSVHLCPKLSIPMTLGNNVIMIKPTDIAYNYFIYMTFKWFYGRDLIKGITGGSAMPKFNKTDFKSLKLVIPDYSTLSKFNSLVSKLIEQVTNFNHSNQRLSQTRDTLLPKLMSGELRINEIDC